MSIEAFLLFLGLGVIVAALAIYLITVAAMLNHVSFTVGTVLVGVRAIAHQTAPIQAVVSDLVREVEAIDSTLDSLVLYAEEAEELAATPTAGAVQSGTPPSAPAGGRGRR